MIASRSGTSPIARAQPSGPSIAAGAASYPSAASKAASIPSRAALPTPTFFAAVGRFSTRPADWLAAMPSACQVCSAERPSSFAQPAAAPNTPQVAVMCQPRA